MIRGFIKVGTEAGPMLLGIAQIVSISHGLSKRGRFTDIRMGDGSICTAHGSVDDVLDLIEDAVEGPGQEEAAPVDPTPTAPPVNGAPPPQMEVKKDIKKRGRPPKATG